MSAYGSLTDVPATLLLVGARVIDPRNGEDRVRDLAILDGRLCESARLPADAPASTPMA